MKTESAQIDSGKLVETRDEGKLASINASYLKELALSFLGEFLSEVEALDVSRGPEIDHGLSLRDEVRRFEIGLIRYALQRTGGHQARAAALLGMKATTLNSKVKLYRLNTKRLRQFAARESTDLSGFIQNDVEDENRATVA
jgi:DNA-binding NtrC family response regulator